MKVIFSLIQKLVLKMLILNLYILVKFDFFCKKIVCNLQFEHFYYLRYDSKAFMYAHTLVVAEIATYSVQA